MNNKEKKEIIIELKNESDRIKRIISKYRKRKRRPIIIEFSGAPKSGKTTCINSLMQFLKRNDYEVKVVAESAGICPVKDKHSPIFNIWTACNSIVQIISALETERNKYDVIIIDRGIFDSLCWFQWLYNNNRIDIELKRVVEAFLSINEFKSYIDIVFVFVSEPKISIEREYASLLTDVRGSIMNESVLESYKEAVDYVYKNITGFRNKVLIDTSEMKQNEVGKIVTEKTLSIIGKFFDEDIGYIEEIDRIRDIFGKKPIITIEEFVHNWIDGPVINFGRREDLEKAKDSLGIQVVPIAVIKDKRTGKVLIVRKSEGERIFSVEDDRDLPYIGGHIRIEDYSENFIATCKAALGREVREEIGISLSLDNCESIEVIYARDGLRSDCHMAVCFLINVDEDNIKIRMESPELVNKHARSKSGKFVKVESIDKKNNTWTRIILSRYFELPEGQMSLFDIQE